MKRLRAGTVAVFVVVLGVFVWFFLGERDSDATYPTIAVETETLEVSIHDGADKLLEGVTAWDEKDGDITSKVLIESVSQFVEGETCTVTYAVADQDRHVAKATRRLRYTDYTPPRFTLEQPLVFSAGTTLRISDLIGAEDCIDGDISEKVLTTSTNYEANSVGVFYLDMEVGNSKGDVVYLEFPVYVEERNQRAPTITLSDYLIYAKKGEKLDFKDYISTVTSEYSTLDDSGVVISQEYQKDVPGVYSIHYYAWDVLGNEGHTVLTVVVEE